jgi:uncharacterized damage-inducible protein DinB
MILRPQPDEYAPYYAGYIGRVPPDVDLLELMSQQPDELNGLLRDVSETQAEQHPAPGEWSIKEVIGHLCDTERIFAYRALCIARGDTTPLPGFEQDAYVRGTNFNARRLSDLTAELAAQRQANVHCFKPLTQDELARMGTASTFPVSVRALLYMMAGHVMHHIESLKTDYKV